MGKKDNDDSEDTDSRAPAEEAPTGGKASDPVAGSTAGSPSGPPIFQLSDLALPSEFEATAGGTKLLTTVPARNPRRHEFVRTHPEYGARVGVFRSRLERDETFIVHPRVCAGLGEDVTPAALRLATTRQGVVFVWVLRLPRSDGRFDEWGRSALEAATLAKDRWVRVSANMSLGAYEIYTASGDIPEPEWPTQSFDDLVQLAFRDHFIDSLLHPALRQLRGEI